MLIKIEQAKGLQFIYNKRIKILINFIYKFKILQIYLVFYYKKELLYKYIIYLFIYFILYCSYIVKIEVNSKLQ